MIFKYIFRFKFKTEVVQAANIAFDFQEKLTFSKLREIIFVTTLEILDCKYDKKSKIILTKF